MKVIRNCTYAIRTVFHYAPWNVVLYTIGYFVPAFFTGLQMLLVQQIVDSGGENFALWSGGAGCWWSC